MKLRAVVLLSMLLTAAGCARTIVDVHRDAADDLRPIPLQLGPKKSVPVAMSVRVYADQTYRRVPLWRRDIRRQFERVSRFTASWFGVSLAVESIREWNRKDPDGDLQTAFDQLTGADAGVGVHWVAGFIGPQRGRSLSHKVLGRAHPISPYFVMRRMSDSILKRWLHDYVDALSDREIGRRYKEMVHHLEDAILLHEWGHTLGAVHVRDSTAIMSLGYDRKVHRFAAPNFDIVKASLAGWRPGLNTEDALAGLRPIVRELLRESEYTRWHEPSRQQAIAMLGGDPRTRVRLSVLEPADRLAVARAVEAFEQVEPERAWRHLERVADAHPKDLQVQRLACHVQAMLDKASEKTKTVCNAAIELASRGFLPPIQHAQLAIAAGRLDDALDQLRAAGRRMKGDPSVSRADWRQLAELFMTINAVSFAELALSKAGAAKNPHLQRWILSTRRSRALPRDRKRSGVQAEDEPAYITGQETALNQVRSGKTAEARAAVKVLIERFPEAAGPLVVRCELRLRAGPVRKGHKDCKEALVRDPEAVEAELLLGQYALQRRRPGKALEHLNRAKELAPDRAYIDRLLMKARRKPR